MKSDLFFLTIGSGKEWINQLGITCLRPLFPA